MSEADIDTLRERCDALEDVLGKAARYAYKMGSALGEFSADTRYANVKKWVDMSVQTIEAVPDMRDLYVVYCDCMGYAGEPVVDRSGLIMALMNAKYKFRDVCGHTHVYA